MRKITNESLWAVHTGSLKENKKKNIKGITLVALVVTIVILLILAGISIAALTQTGLFGKAKQAEQKSKDAQELENSTLGSYGNLINEIVSTGSREESDNNNQYSLEEKAIGTWIDGKIIYRKVIETSSNNKSDDSSRRTFVFNPILNNVDNIIDYSGQWEITEGTYYTGTKFSFDNSNILNNLLTAYGQNITVNNGICDFNVSITNTWGTSSIKAFIIIEYTKTTN